MKAAPIINNFSAGEFGPLTRARTDLDRYSASQELMQNFIPTIQGAATKRTGTKYVAEVGYSANQARLVPFVYSNEQAYVLEFQENTIRFYTNGAQIESGGNPYEITTTYAGSDIFELSFTQSNDILYIFHKDYAPQKLIRYADDNWSFTSVLNYTGPYLGYEFANESATFQANNDLTSSATSGTTTITNGNVTTINNATAHTTGEILLTVVLANVRFRNGQRVLVSGVSGTTEANGVWFVEVIGANSVVLKGSTFVNAYVGGSDFIRPAPFQSTDVGRFLRIYDISGTPDQGWVYMQITAYTNEYTVDAEILENSFASAPISLGEFEFGAYSDTTGYPSAGCFFQDRLFFVGPSQYVAASRTGDYENFLQEDSDGTITDSHALLFSLSSSTVSNCRWVVSDEKGVLVGTSDDEWLVRSASSEAPISPTSIEARKTTSYGSKQIQAIQAGKAALFVQSSGRKIREFNYFYDVDGFRAQDLTQLAHHITKSGVTSIAIQRQPEQIIWATRGDGVLIGCTYERDLDGLRVAWHRHIIGGLFFRNPLDDGTDHAFVESVCCIPTSDNSYDEIWLVVARDIDGSRVRYVEYISEPFSEEEYQQDGFFVDSGLTYDDPKTITDITQANPAVVTSASHGFNNDDHIRIDNSSGMEDLNGNIYVVKNKTANTFELYNADGTTVNSTNFDYYVAFAEARKLVTSISGLGHLEGETVRVCADGSDAGEYTVSSGSITLDERAAVVHVGLSYQCKIKTNRIEAGSQDGTSIGKTRRIHRLGLMLYRTLGLKIGQDFDDMKSLEFQDGDDQVDQASSLFTGIYSAEFDADYDFDNQVCIMHDYPTPCTLQAIMPLMVTQDR